MDNTDSNTNSFTELVIQLRNKKNLTQREIAKLSKIPASTYSMLECGKRKPTYDVLMSLSNVLKFDLVTFYENQNSYISMEHYLFAKDLIDLVDSNDIENIANNVKNNPIINEFNYGEPEIIKVYCEIILLIEKEKNIELAYTTCIEFLNITTLDEFVPRINMPCQYYSIISKLGDCLYQKKMYDDFIVLYEILIKFLEKLYFNDFIIFVDIPDFYRNYYILCLSNLSKGYFSLNKFDVALKICDKGIEKSSEVDILNMFTTLLKLKVEILCKLDNYSEAKETYIQYKSLCSLALTINCFDASTIEFKEKYPNLFTTE